MQRQMNKISVCMATYNGGKYIIEQLESILAQTLAPNEIIIVDDCSTDNTWQILQKYASLNAQIKIFKNNINSGVTKTFERALSLTIGDYVALADQDDYWLSNKLEVLANNIDANLLIYSDYYIVDNKLNVLFKSSHEVLPYHDGSLSMFYLRCNVPGCATLYSRKLLDLALQFPEDIISHDHYLVIVAKYLGEIKYINQKLLKYRQHSHNVSGGIYQKNYDEMIAYFIKHSKFCTVFLKSKFHFEKKELIIIKNYFDSIVKAKPANVGTLYWVLRKLGWKKVLSVILYSYCGRRLARFFYKLSHS